MWISFADISILQRIGSGKVPPAGSTLVAGFFFGYAVPNWEHRPEESVTIILHFTKNTR